MVDVTVVLPIYNPLRRSDTYLTDAIDCLKIDCLEDYGDKYSEHPLFGTPV